MPMMSKNEPEPELEEDDDAGGDDVVFVIVGAADGLDVGVAAVLTVLVAAGESVESNAVG
jgi:hypothetical protein